MGGDLGLRQSVAVGERDDDALCRHQGGHCIGDQGGVLSLHLCCLRGVIVELTPDGLEVVDTAVAALAVSDRQLMERLDPSDAAALEELLRRFLAGLELSDE